MTNPDQEDAASQETFEEKVNLALKTAERDDAGKLKLPEDTPEEVAFAAVSVLRQKDTQKAYTKGQQKLNAVNAEKEFLLNQLDSNVQIDFTPEQAEELEGLKHSDPDAWYGKLKALEDVAKSEHTKELGEQMKSASDEGAKKAELVDRGKELAQYLVDNPDFALDDDIIANDVPQRYAKALDSGKVTFTEYLDNVRDYLAAGKVVGDGGDPLNHPNLGKAGGGDAPSAEASDKAGKTSYKQVIF